MAWIVHPLLDLGKRIQQLVDLVDEDHNIGMPIPRYRTSSQEDYKKNAEYVVSQLDILLDSIEFLPVGVQGKEPKSPLEVNFRKAVARLQWSIDISLHLAANEGYRHFLAPLFDVLPSLMRYKDQTWHPVKNESEVLGAMVGLISERQWFDLLINAFDPSYYNFIRRHPSYRGLQLID